MIEQFQSCTTKADREDGPLIMALIAFAHGGMDVNKAQSLLPDLILDDFDLDLEIVSKPNDKLSEDAPTTFLNLLTSKTNQFFAASRTIECVAAKRAGFGELSRLLAKCG